MSQTTGVTMTNNSFDDFVLEKQKKTADNSMGRDQFMKLMLAQLQNQDPTSPMENADMMAQLAQFSALEAMQGMATATNSTQAYSLIGKGIVGYIRDSVSGAVTDIVGTVDSAGVEGGKPYVKVGNATIQLENVTQVFDNSIIAGDSAQLLAGTSMVGKYVRAEFPTDAGATYIEGKVERVSVRDNKLYVTVDGAEVGLYQIINVADTREELGAVPVAAETEAAADGEAPVSEDEVE